MPWSLFHEQHLTKLISRYAEYLLCIKHCDTHADFPNTGRIQALLWISQVSAHAEDKQVNLQFSLFSRYKRSFTKDINLDLCLKDTACFPKCVWWPTSAAECWQVDTEAKAFLDQIHLKITEWIRLYCRVSHQLLLSACILQLSNGVSQI